MPLSPLEYLRHMLAEATYLMDAGKNLTKDRFLRDETIKRAFVRSVEIIGEATKKTPDELKAPSTDQLASHGRHEGPVDS